MNPALLLWVGKHWKLVVWLVSVGALGLTVGIQKAELRHKDKVIAGKDRALTDQAHAFALASATARANALDAARAKEQHDNQIRDQKDHDLSTELASARADLARWMRARRADQGSPGSPNLPGQPASAALADGPDRFAVVDGVDLDRCTQAVVRLQNAQDWAKLTLTR